MADINLGNISEEDIKNTLDSLQGFADPSAYSAPTGMETEQPIPTQQPPTGGQVQTPQPPQEQQPTEGIRGMDQVYADRAAAGEPVNRPGVGGFLRDTVEGTARSAYEGLAPMIGVSDTIIDTFNFLSAGDTFDLPKLPKYESDVYQALRNVSGLIIPSLGLRGMLLNAGTKAHAAGTAAPWLQKLGNIPSFQAFSKIGADIGTAGFVDYVSQQSQEDDNLFGTLKQTWPQLFQWIPEGIATNPDDSAGRKRSKNVNEGAIFGLLGSLIEGAMYLTKAGKSMSRTAKFATAGDNKISAKRLKELTEDEFTNIKYSDEVIEDTALRNYAREEKSLQELSEYYISRGQEPPDWPMFDVGEKLVRTVDDDGLPGMMADAAQIQFNIESGWGRLGNIVSEAAWKEGIELPNLTNRTLVSQVTQQLKEVGPISKTLRSGTKISHKLIDEAGKTLAATLLHPRVDKDDIIGILDEFKRSIEGSPVRIAGQKGINKAVKALKDQMLDLDVHKARGYLVTSASGQVADALEGARLMEDGVSVLRTVDLMADRLEVLMVEKGLANFEANSMLSHMNTWKKAVDTGDQKIMTVAAETILGNSDSKLTEIIPNAKAWTQTLKEIARENPAFLKPFLLANEFTDGNVDTMFKLHQWAGNNLGVFKKAIYDGNPEVPSIVNTAWWGTIYNSWLSAIGTPLRAGAGNLTGLLGRGAATVTGAVLQGDLAAANKAMVAHFALDDTLSKAFDHMRLVFRKASNNPKEVSYVMRSDVAIKTEKGLDSLRAYADAASENGEEGANMLLNVFEDLEALAMDPVLRFGSNSMTAFDGFAKSVVSNTEAKYTAINKLVQAGEELTDKNIKAISDDIYNKAFDNNGMISNDAVDSITSEIALNADSPVVDGMNQFIKRFPAARAFIVFPRTTANVIDTFGKWSPAGVFSADHYKLWGPLGNKKLGDFTNEEIVDFLKSKGRPIDEFMLENFDRIRHEVKGKAAIGSLMVTAAGFAGINDRCTGTGHYNKAVQRTRIRQGWKAKTCQIPGTNKVGSYEWMGPVGDWLALTLDVVDNADSLTSAMQEDMYQKLTFLLASALTNRSILSQLEPLHDVLQGNSAAAARFATSFGNNLMPLGGLRNEIGKLLYPGLRQLRGELDELLRNRNAWLDGADPSRSLARMVDPVDGKEVGNEPNWFWRMANIGPAKVHSKPSKESQFLIDIEFNSSPNMRMSQRGAELRNHEIEAINTKMGDQGIWKESINDIMRDANKLKYTAPDGTVYKGFVNIIRAQRRGSITSEILDTAKYANIFNRLRVAYSQAKRHAENSLDEPMLSAIRDREYQLMTSEQDQKAGNLDQVYQDAGLQETLNIYK